MTTTNLISTPNITGNIGSCEIKDNKIQSGNTFFTETYTETQVNSCTGEVVGNYTWVEHAGAIGTGILTFIALIMIIAVVTGVLIQKPSSFY